MKRAVVVGVTAFALVVAGCSSSDPSASEEYQALEQELAETEQQLGEVAAERDSLTPEGGSLDVGQGPVPDEVVALIDQWKHATATSMVDLYTPTGFHLYGAQKITGDDIGVHLARPEVTDHEELTPLLLIVEEPGRRYVVTQGIANTIFATKSPSGLSWEIVKDAEGTLRIAKSAWLGISAN